MHAKKSEITGGGDLFRKLVMLCTCKMQSRSEEGVRSGKDFYLERINGIIKIFCQILYNEFLLNRLSDPRTIQNEKAGNFNMINKMLEILFQA